MKRSLMLALALVAVSVAPAFAALQTGTTAPDFKLQASMGGKVFPFSLADALKRGPVVVYFYPAAFTTGCTIEAHDFAAAMDQYKALHATVIGVSHDDIAKLQKFSVSDCRSKFPVAADTDQSVAKSYDAVLTSKYDNRTSYVIAPNGKVIYAYTNMEPDQHVANTLKAIKDWEAKGH